MRSCSVKNCFSVCNGQRRFYYFPLPKQEERFQLWVKFCQDPTLTNIVGRIFRCVCDLHFRQEDFDSANRLQRNAVPSLNGPSHVPEKIQDRRKITSVEIECTPDISDIARTDTTELAQSIPSKSTPSALPLDVSIESSPTNQIEISLAQNELSKSTPVSTPSIVSSESTSINEVAFSKSTPVSVLSGVSAKSSSVLSSPYSATKSVLIAECKKKIPISIPSIGQTLAKPSSCPDHSYTSKDKLDKSSDVSFRSDSVTLKDLHMTRKQQLTTPAERYLYIYAKKKESQLRKLTAKHKIIKEQMRDLCKSKNSTKAAFELLSKHLSVPASLFLSSQLKSLDKTPHGRRWTDEEKTLALSLYKKSPNAYAMMRDAFMFPSKRTLLRVNSKFPVTCEPTKGNEIFAKLCQHAEQFSKRDKKSHHATKGSRKSSVVNDKSGLTIKLDVQEYRPEELSIKVDNKFLVIEGIHEEKSNNHSFVSRQFTRRYPLPDDLHERAITYNISHNGILQLCVPKLETLEFDCGTPTNPITKELDSSIKKN